MKTYKVVVIKHQKQYEKQFLELPKRLYKKEELMQNEAEEIALLQGTHCLSHYFTIQPILVLNHKGQAVARAMMTFYEGESHCYIGFFECIKSKEVSALLFHAAEKEARKRNRTKIIGPVNASFWIQYRLKVNRFKQPYTGEPYNKSYYKKLFSLSGYSVTDRYYSNQFEVVPKEYENETFKERLQQKLKEGYQIKSPTASEFSICLGQIYDLMIELYKNFPTYRYITKEEFIQMYEKLKKVINYSMVKLVYKENEAVGFYVSVPNYNNLTQGALTVGKLIKILLVKRHPNEYVMLYMGISEKHHGLGKAITESIKQELQKNQCTSIGALIHSGKINSDYYEELRSGRYEYVLLEKILV